MVFRGARRGYGLEQFCPDGLWRRRSRSCRPGLNVTRSRRVGYQSNAGEGRRVTRTRVARRAMGAGGETKGAENFDNAT